MASRREIAREQAEKKIVDWLKRHSGKFWRIVDIASATNLPVPAVNNALRDLSERNCGVVRETRRKARNSKRYPVYQMNSYYSIDVDSYTSASDIHPPSWLCPIPPSLTTDQIKGVRTVLGFTGDMRAKKFLESGFPVDGRIKGCAQ